MTNAKKVKENTTVATVVAKADNSNTPIVTKESLYKTTKAIEAAIVAAIAAGNTVQQEYQRIACSAMVHLYQHGDIRIVRHLLATLPEGMRKVSMATFFDKFAPVTFDDDGEVHYNKERKLDLAGALSLAWWKAAKEAVYTPFVLEAELKKLIEKASKKLAKGVKEGDHVTNTMLVTLQSAYQQLTDQANIAQAELEQEAIAA